MGRAGDGFALSSVVVALGVLSACGRTEGAPSGVAGGAGGAGAAGGTGGLAASGASGGGAGGAAGGVSGAGAGGSPEPTDKLDLLFMIDNSATMGDKQAVLRDSVPQLLAALIDPPCAPSSAGSVDASCPPGQTRAFQPVTDIHIGVISSSLGGHGGDVCKTAGPGFENVLDMAHLIGKIRGPAQVAVGAPTIDPSTTWNGSGFLAWDPSGTRNIPPGEANAGQLTQQFQNMLSAVGEAGCGYEAQLESWYRFLIDPDPPATVVTATDPSNPGVTITVTSGPDQEILLERAEFLRPDSAVGIIMLTDENDCSVGDFGSAWVIGLNSGGAHLPPGTSTCLDDPNSVCCRSCSAPTPVGCMPSEQDPQCLTPLTALTDSLALRCYREKQRFGFDLLYPVQRYINGLQGGTVLDRQGNPAQNGLYAGAAPRDPSRVFLVGIVGVPWQDLATSDTLNDPSHLRYLSAAELGGRWPALLGDPSASPPVEPGDPFMVETFLPRSGSNPFTGAAIAPTSSTNPQENPINGHEQNVPVEDDLQYACTFRLATPRQCAPGDGKCDCSANSMGSTQALTAINSPLCQPPQGGAAATTQYYAKAYPGLRELQVLEGVGANSVVASICPKVLDPNSADYGYAPAMSALVGRLQGVLR